MRMKYLFLPLMALLVVACSDYETFSDNPSFRLEFSKDTIAFDTLISTIAEQCGILDVAYFSRVFRQYYGMTPTQARHK